MLWQRLSIRCHTIPRQAQTDKTRPWTDRHSWASSLAYIAGRANHRDPIGITFLPFLPPPPLQPPSKHPCSSSSSSSSSYVGVRCLLTHLTLGSLGSYPGAAPPPPGAAPPAPGIPGKFILSGCVLCFSFFSLFELYVQGARPASSFVWSLFVCSIVNRWLCDQVRFGSVEGRCMTNYVLSSSVY